MGEGLKPTLSKNQGLPNLPHISVEWFGTKWCRKRLIRTVRP